MYRFIKIKAFNCLNQNKNVFNRQIVTTFVGQQQRLDPQSSDEKELRETVFENAYKEALNNPDYFGVNKLFTVRQLFESRAHFGHKMGTLNEHMKPYIFGDRLGTLIFDLDQTAQRLQEALNFTAHLAFRGGIILFINRSINTAHLVEKMAKECGEYSHCREWDSHCFHRSTKFFGAVTRLPDLVIFLNTMNNVFETHPAVIDSAKLLIPTVGVVDTNSDPTLITYPIPANDDTYSTIKYFCGLFKQSVLLGKERRKQLLNNTKI